MNKKVCDVPALMEKWAANENSEIGLEPDKLASHSTKKAWWRCVEKMHLYQRDINSESLGRQCPICRKEQVITVSKRPDLMKKWAFKENELLGLSPENLSIQLSTKAWWKCTAKGHLYQRSIMKEALFDRQCPECRKETQTMISDRLDLMEKWVFEKNEKQGLFPDKTTVGSAKYAWWKCTAKGHLYQRQISHESYRNCGCPVCKNENTKHLSDHPELLAEFAYDLNDVSPEDITEGNDTPIYWRCKEHGHVWKAQTYHRLKEHTGCPYCSNKSILLGYNDLATINPPNLKYWDYSKNEEAGIVMSDYTPSSKANAWWLCDKGHSTFDSIKKVLSRRTACSECLRLAKQIRATIALEETARKAEKAQKREEDSAKRGQERFQKEQERLERQIEVRQKRVVAALAARQKAAEKRGITVLQTSTEPSEFQMTTTNLTELIAPYWDLEANQERGFKLDAVTMNRLYYCKCKKGHQWKSDLRALLVDPGCPVCKTEENSIAQKYPYLIDIYDTKKNGGVPPSQVPAKASNYHWWTCKNGHSFVATLANVVSHKETGCMFCDKEKSIYSL